MGECIHLSAAVMEERTAASRTAARGPLMRLCIPPCAPAMRPLAAPRVGRVMGGCINVWAVAMGECMAGSGAMAEGTPLPLAMGECMAVWAPLARSSRAIPPR